MTKYAGKLSIFAQLQEVLKGQEGKLVYRADVVQAVSDRFGTNPGSVILSDYCYNRFNNGIPFKQHLFEYVTRSTYKYLGECYPYNGLIFHKKKGSSSEEAVGEWLNGEKFLYDSEAPVSKEQLMRMYEEYMRIFRFELAVLKCAPTELRHLLGRIGELHCAIHTDGTLAKEVNQHGFDVIGGNGRRISVKATAQKKGAGFVTFNSNTFDRFEDVYILQYSEDDFHVMYFGEKEPIREAARVYDNKYELDMVKISLLAK